MKLNMKKRMMDIWKQRLLVVVELAWLGEREYRWHELVFGDKDKEIDLLNLKETVGIDLLYIIKYLG